MQETDSVNNLPKVIKLQSGETGWASCVALGAKQYHREPRCCKTTILVVEPKVEVGKFKEAAERPSINGYTRVILYVEYKLIIYHFKKLKIDII